MIIDSRTLDEGIQLVAQVCIIGAGVAGIAIARELESRSIDTLLLESGGLQPDRASRDLYRGENVGVPYVFGDGCRSRYFGGSSNCWGGMCRPLDEQDMTFNDWVADSGWPLDSASLEPYYTRASRYLRLGPTDYNVGTWIDAIDNPKVRRMPLPSGNFEDLLTQLTDQTALGRLYQRELHKARHVRVLTHANVVELETDAEGHMVCCLSVKTFSGVGFKVRAAAFVLACGGIENARLMLASNASQPFGVGNANDLVGRYFADHPRIALGEVFLRPEWQSNKLYNSDRQYRKKALSFGGTCITSQFALKPEVRRNERLLNAQIWFASILPARDSVAATAMTRLHQRLYGKSDWDAAAFQDLCQVIRHPVDAAAFLATWGLRSGPMINRFEIEIICEPVPLRDSRVTLSSQKDQLGVPRVRVDWRISDEVLRTMDRTLALFAEELRVAGVGEVRLPPPLEQTGLRLPDPQPWFNLGCWHHMGTTRMHASPDHGVVDPDCKVHGVDNLYVAGSSVFPSYGANFPTLTIAALALRLADHLAKNPSLT